jgi:hypothetical protein
MPEGLADNVGGRHRRNFTGLVAAHPVAHGVHMVSIVDMQAVLIAGTNQPDIRSAEGFYLKGH